MAILQTTGLTGSLSISSSGFVSGDTLLSVNGYNGRIVSINDKQITMGSSSLLFITSSNRIGIGTITPQASLHVFGTISASSFGSGSFNGTASYTATASYIGQGIDNYITKWKTNNVTSSNIFDNGTYIGVGFNNPKAKFEVSWDTSSNTPIPQGYANSNVFHGIASENGQTVIVQLSAINGGHAVFQGTRYNGTWASPTRLLNGDEMLGITGRGWNGSTVIDSISAINFNADGDWNSGSTATNMTFFTCTSGSTTNTLVFELAQTSSAGILGSLGVGTFNPSLFGYNNDIFKVVSVLSPNNTNSGRAILELAGNTNNTASGQTISQIDFTSLATTVKRIGTISGILTGSSANLGLNLAFYTSPDGTAGISERMRITNVGSVGIGTTNPTQLVDIRGGILQLSGSTNTSVDILTTSASISSSVKIISVISNNRSGECQFQLTDGANAFGWLFINAGSTKIPVTIRGDAPTDSLNISSSGTVTMTGSVGIGTSFPSYKLDVSDQRIATGSNRVVASFSGPTINNGGSTIVRIANGRVLELEQNDAGTTPFRFGTFGDTNIVNSSSFTSGVFGSINFITSGSSRMTIAGGTSAGRIGINTSAPKCALNVSIPSLITNLTSSNSYIHIGGSEFLLNGYRAIGFGYSDASTTFAPAYIAYQETSVAGFTLGDLSFWTRPNSTNTSPTERMRILSSGNIGIGTSSPGGTLHVQGNITASSITASLNGIASTSSFTVSSSYAVTSSFSNASALSSVATSSVFSITSSYLNSSNISMSAITASKAIINALGINTAAPTGVDFQVVGSTQFSNGSSGATHIPYTDGNIYLSAPTIYIRNAANNVYASFDGSKLSGTASYAITAGNTISSSYSSNGIQGGTNNYLPKWSSNQLTTTSQVYDDGTFVGIGITTPSAFELLRVDGDVQIDGDSNIVGRCSVSNGCAITGSSNTSIEGFEVFLGRASNNYISVGYAGDSNYLKIFGRNTLEIRAATDIQIQANAGNLDIYSPRINTALTMTSFTTASSSPAKTIAGYLPVTVNGTSRYIALYS